jgi:predicted enzyme related to lactoylglutathione lyase
MIWTGRFIWHDLMTTNREVAAEFYRALFGWKLDEMKMGPFRLSLITVGDRRVGSVMQENNLPHSHWVSHVAVDDVDAICRRVAEIGGRVCIGAGEVPQLGRFAMIEDPQGAVLWALKRPANRLPPPDTPDTHPAPGSFVWDELLTSDPESAADFYRALLNWNIEKIDMGPQPYWLVKQGARDFAGIMQQSGSDRPAWTAYVSVTDIDASTARAKELGATILLEPRDIPNVGRFSVIADPTGAALALYRSVRH